jgi:UDP-3-O-acyl N-acetylglucosamine deacetylase
VTRLSYRWQRTIAGPAEVRGVGFVTGARVRLRFLPAPPSSGVVFLRTDLKPRAVVPAHVLQVTDTRRRTTLGAPPGQVCLVEHVLAALAGLKIDNCTVELDAPEPPGLDGSSGGFVEALLAAGLTRQPERRPVWAPAAPVTLAVGGATLTWRPADAPGLTLTYFLDYGLRSSIGRQTCTVVVTPGSFAQRLARCRTFILESEVEELRRQGLGKHTTARDLLVFGPRGPIDNRLRWADEPARHKLLDLVGDLALLGADLSGHVVAYRSGHPLNVELVRQLHQRLAAPCAPRAAA